MTRLPRVGARRRAAPPPARCPGGTRARAHLEASPGGRSTVQDARASREAL